MRAPILPILVLVAAACTAGAPAGAPAEPAPSPAPATARPAAAPGGPAAPPAAKAPAFADLIGAGKGGSFKVTYKITGTGLGDAGAGEQTWYVKPPKSRFDFRTGGEATSLFVLEAGTYLCTTSYGQATCFGLPGQAPSPNIAAQVETSVRGRPSDLDPLYEGARTIAGQPGHCYAIKAKAADLGFGQGRFCYREDGLLLLMQSSGSGFDFTMEATSVGVASDADFQLPAKP